MRWTARSNDAETAFAAARRAVRGANNVLRTRYPLFLLGLPVARGEIPVFIYHDVEPASFAGDLEFLRANGYRTISLDEFLSAAARKGTRGDKRVLLTFDDARRSFYEVALPTLRTFDARATLFVPSYWMRPLAITGSALFMSWQQVRLCAASGYVDVQSHAHRHALVAISNQLVGFASPRLIARHDVYDWPMRHTATAEGLGPPPLGAPIYRAAPLLSAGGRFLESPELATICIQRVSELGGEAFFNLSDWATQLHGLHDSHSRVLQGELMTQAGFARLLASELELAQGEFRAQLGYAPTSLAYPWMLGSRNSLELARHHGFRNAFGVALDYRRARHERLPLPAFGRLRSDWLPLLPGRGRASFLSIAARKLVRPRGQPLAH
jgi:peptidoglycan/xylan/chitin deacetylase (PgdA/CDA1 family)